MEKHSLWWIQGTGTFGMRAPLGPISFIFMLFSAKCLPNNRLAPLSLRLADSYSDAIVLKVFQWGNSTFGKILDVEFEE